MRYTTSRSWPSQHIELLEANRTRLEELTVRPRYVVAALSVLGGYLIYRWSRQLFGPMAGLVGLALWCLCPNVLAWAGIANVDVGAAVFGLAAMYAFRYYLCHAGWLTALWSGLVLGLALLTKFTLLVLYPVLLLSWLVAWCQTRGSKSRPGAAIRWLHFAIILVASVFIINMGYGFQGVGRPLGSFSFICDALTRDENGTRINRFRETCLEHLPVPLPAALIVGLDYQKSHDDTGFDNYLRGQWRHGGWWYYYLYVLAVKVPIGTLALFVLCLLLLLRGRHYRCDVIDELLIWLPAAAILLLISSQTGINSHLRYALPLFPFLFISISRVGLLLADFAGRLQQRRLAPLLGSVVVIAALSWNASAAARIHPHYLSYFNELAGGPDNGWRHLLDSNIDWGQDLLFLKRWVEEHPEARPLNLAYLGDFDPNLVGLDYQLPPFGYDLDNKGLPPGWYAVSVNLVYGEGFGGYNGHGRAISVPVPGVYSYFGRLTPVDKAGYSLFIYHVTDEQATRLRARLKHPPTNDPQSIASVGE